MGRGREVVVLYSGGTDSTCVAALAAQEFDRVHLLTFEESATRGSPVPTGNVSRLRSRFGDRFDHHVLDVDWLIERVAYGRYLGTIRRHGLFAAATPGFSSLAWHARALLYCLENGIKEVHDGVTRELTHFPGHMEAVQAEFRRLYARFGVVYRSPVRDWEVPPDRRFLEQMVVDRHAELLGVPGEGRSDAPGRTTGRYLHGLGLMPEADVKGTTYDRAMQHDCYPFVLFNMLVFWHWLAWDGYERYERRMAALFRDKVDELAGDIEAGRLREGARPASGWFARTAGAALVALAALSGVEGAARAWAARRGDALDLALPVLRADAALGWRQREGLDREFAGRPLRTDARGFRVPAGREREDAPSAAVLGPSSAFGWGVAEDETYARRWEALLRARSPGARVLNAGEIGFSSWQGLALYRREVAALGPRAVVIAYGVNDVDRHRFFFDGEDPDSRALPPKTAEPFLLGVQNAVNRLSAPSMLRRRLVAAARRRFCAAFAPPPAPPGRRVEPAQFAANLDALISEARGRGARVLLVTTPALLPEPAPRGAADPGGCRAAYGHWSELARAGRCGEAEKALEAARACEPARLAADIRGYNELARDSARRAGAPLVDAERLLGREPAHFVDPIHPSASGHALIAAALEKAMPEVP